MIWHDRVSDPIRREEVMQRVKSGLSPLLTDIPGLQSSYVIAVGEADIYCLAVYHAIESAEAAAAATTRWTDWYVSALLSGQAKVLVGEASDAF
jgi:hypothetical protein